MTHKKHIRRSSYMARRRRFGNPWAFRRSVRVERIAGIDGRELTVVTHRRNGQVVHTIRGLDPFEPAVDRLPERSMLPFLRRLVSAEIARYRMSGLFSETEARTIALLWQEGLSLRAVARLENISPQAVEDRIVRLEHRARRFYLWWRLKNRPHARRRI